MKELTEADKVMIRALAQVVIVDRAAAAMDMGANAKGRTVVKRVGQLTEAELRWEAIGEEFA